MQPPATVAGIAQAIARAITKRAVSIENVVGKAIIVKQIRRLNKAGEQYGSDKKRGKQDRNSDPKYAKPEIFDRTILLPYYCNRATGKPAAKVVPSQTFLCLPRPVTVPLFFECV
ncbi:MAG: hypothetical protein IIA98_01270 [Proteobacteria bacterium]|nr:hypothetical protein [Pseudomonadota bacterium]